MPEVKNILVVRKHNQIGDMLSSLSLYAALKKKYPKASISLAASKTNYPIPYKEINPFIDEVFIYDKSSLKTIFNFYYRLRKKKFDIGIVPSTIKLSRSSHVINFLSGAKKRIGINSIDGVPNKSAFFLNVKGDFYWESKKKHQSERNLEVANLIGCSLNESDKNIGLRISDSEKREAIDFIKDNFSKDVLILGIHPGAGKELNTWNYNYFIEVLGYIKNKRKVEVLITCGEIDKVIIDKVTGGLEEKGICYKLAYNFPVLRLAAILELLDIYITNDTGTMHIAGKTNVKQISLFGPTNIYEWGPSGENKINIQSPTKAINDITPAAVTSAAFSLLKIES